MTMRPIAASLALAAALMLALPGQSRAASYVAQDIWYSTLYGGAIGGVGGLGVMLLKDEPLEHSDYVVRGVGIGILAGMVYGIYSYAATSRTAAVNEGGAVAAFDADGEARFRMPLVRPYLAKAPGGQEVQGVGLHMNLIHGRF